MTKVTKLAIAAALCAAGALYLNIDNDIPDTTKDPIKEVSAKIEHLPLPEKRVPTPVTKTVPVEVKRSTEWLTSLVSIWNDPQSLKSTKGDESACRKYELPDNIIRGKFEKSISYCFFTENHPRKAIYFWSNKISISDIGNTMLIKSNFSNHYNIVSGPFKGYRLSTSKDDEPMKEFCLRNFSAEECENGTAYEIKADDEELASNQ